jgi:prephenate dehydrogenase
VHWKKVSLVGVGLLGGSLGLALRQRGLAESVTGFVRRVTTAKDCKRLGAVDSATLDLAEALAGADLVVLCTPIAQMLPLVKQMSALLQPGAIVTDVGSVKATVVDSLSPIIKKAGAVFIGSHPMAGSERTGVRAADAELFVDAVCVVTPSRDSEPRLVKKVSNLWKSVGARILVLDPRIHDKFVSRSSHLPHVVAAQLANLVLGPKSPKQQELLCANGFRDTTRIASGSPEMWRDIALANKTNLLTAIDSFMEGLGDFKRVLEAGDAKAILRFFEKARSQRDRWSAKSDGHSPE